MPTLERAIEIAAKAHAGQVDKAGEPYILHPIRVMLGVSGLEAKNLCRSARCGGRFRNHH
jgi:(p)ppGpp synthase/HD superfamily hydrolase